MSLDSVNDQGLELEQTLQDLFDVVGHLEAHPGEIALIQKYLELARKSQMQDQVVRGLEMLVQAVGCTEDVWLEVLDYFEAEIPIIAQDRIPTILQILQYTTQDYLSLDLYIKAGSIIQQLHPSMPTGPTQDDPMQGELPQTIEPRITEDDARRIYRNIVSMAENEMSGAFAIWEQYINWEENVALRKEGEERKAALRAMHGRYIGHLAVPHDHLGEAAQLYSAFNTRHFLEEYEANMIKASGVCSKSLTKYQARESWQTAWTALSFSPLTEDQISLRLSHLFAWLEMETSISEQKNHKGKGRARDNDQVKMEPRCVMMVHEKLLKTLSCWRDSTGRRTESQAWMKYYQFMNETNGIAKADAAKILDRSVRCCPESGDLWAALLRSQENTKKTVDTITGTYMKALGAGELTRTKEKDQVAVAELVALEMAWGGYMRRLLGDTQDEDEDEEEKDDVVESSLRESIERVQSFYPKGDPSFKLELFLISWFGQKLERKGKVEEAGHVWEGLVKLHGKSYLAWTGYVEFLIRHAEYPKARSQLKIASSRQGLDWPEGVWALWDSFEERYGSIENVIAAKGKLASLHEALAKKRLEAAAVQMRNQPVMDIPLQVATNEQDPNVVDSVSSDGTLKRKAEDIPEVTEGDNKRIKLDESEVAQPAPPQRDREFATVLLSGLPLGVTEEMIRQRFSDCGEIREVTINEKEDSAIGAVEFTDRESVLPALTKDQKLIGDNRVHVYRAGQTTLFVTNFPEKADDASVREMFSTYGEILDTRWPSKKYKDNRRFCYVQFLTSEAATLAVELSGRELEPGLALTVLISDPERKKQRSDANADAREVMVSGLSRFVAEKDLARLFSPFGDITRINLVTDDDGHCRGFAFIEYAEEASVQSALALDGTELKKRKMKVRHVDPAAKKGNKSSSALENTGDQKAELLARSVKLTGLPEKTQEGLLQQALEKVTTVKRVEVFVDRAEAIAELASPADVGQLLLQPDAIVYGGKTLGIFAANVPTQSKPSKAKGPRQESSSKPTPSQPAPSQSTAIQPITAQSTTPTVFKPRPPKVGARKKTVNIATFSRAPVTSIAGSGDPSAAVTTGMKDQDAFRQMLMGGKPAT